MNKPELLNYLKSQQQIQDAWWDKLPLDINMAFTDNDYVDSLYASQQELMKVAFGDCFEDAMYLLYEWYEGFSINGEVLNSWEECLIYFGKVCNE